MVMIPQELSKETWLLLERYVANVATDEDVRRLTQQLGTSPEQHPQIIQLRRALKGGPATPAIPDARVALDTLWARLGREAMVAETNSVHSSDHAPSVEATSIQPPRENVQRRAGLRWGSVLALTVLGIAAGLFVYRSSERVSDGLPEQVYTTTTGQRIAVTLDDGTRVTLAPQTTLRVAAFNGQERQVRLDGEAYFHVTQSAGAPFIVSTKLATTQVLGTQFVVRQYDNDRGTRVAVTSGKVTVTARSAQRPNLTLTAGLVGDVTDSSATTSSGDLAQHTGWMSEQLVFHDAPVPEVLTVLSRWYGYEFRFADPKLASETLTAGLSTQSSSEALSTLSLLLNVELAFDGKVVTLTPRSKKSVSAHGHRPLETSTATSLTTSLTTSLGESARQ